MKRAKRIAMVTVVVVVVVLLAAVASAFAVWTSVHNSLSYNSYDYATLRYERTFLTPNMTSVIWAYLNFQSDGPIAAGQPLRLTLLQINGQFPGPPTRIYFQIVMPRVFPIWPVVNESVGEAQPGLGYLFYNRGTGTFLDAGRVALFALLQVWVGSTLYVFVNPQDVSMMNLTVQSAEAWSQYDARRVTSATAVLAFLVPSVPIAIKGTWDSVKPFSRWLSSRLGTTQTKLETFTEDSEAKSSGPKR